MFRSLTIKTVSLLILFGLLVSACSSITEPTPTEVEVEIGPPELTAEVTPQPTQTLRPLARPSPSTPRSRPWSHRRPTPWILIMHTLLLPRNL